MYKVKLSLYLTMHHAMKAYWEWRCSFTRSFTSALDEGEWSASRPDRFTPRETALGTHWIGGWVSLRTVMDAVAKRKIPSPRRESKPKKPDSPARSPALSYHGCSFVLYILHISPISSSGENHANNIWDRDQITNLIIQLL
jgi:hypothetical protein